MFKHIETLEIWGCGSLISLAPSVSSLGNLSHLDVWKCEGLLNLVTSSTAQSMRHLTKLRIRECEMVEEIVAGGEDGREDQITWDNLKSLELRCLASLTCFSRANHTFKFPDLEEVIVTRCPEMKAFSGGVSITPKLKSVKLAVGDAKGCWKGDLNTTIQQLCAELVSVYH
uniref:Disease resistance protein At4g27190-like leucine-rich repeats domain-containing protein n=1 Tax=Rhizophora mucronata TaxID=61149 RepID=A0A2P2MMG8_RHIMU